MYGGSEEARAHLQARLALFSRLIFLVIAGLVLFLLGLYQLYPQTQPERTIETHGFAFGGLIAGGLVWYLALVRGRPSVAQMYRIDLFYMLLISCGFAMSIYFSSDHRENVYA